MFPRAAPTTPTPLSPSMNGGEAPTFLKNGASKIDSLKNWSISTYKCTRQLMLEKLGKSTRTVDTELEAQIEQLRDTQRKYSQILGLTRAFSSHFRHVVHTQSLLSEAFSDLAQKSPELQDEFKYNSETQRSLTKNGEILLSALNFFVSSVNTLCNKTIDDTLLTIRQYENARIEYDAYRIDLENERPDPVATNNEETLKNYNKHKDNYEKLRSDVAVKMQFLDENRVNDVAASTSGDRIEFNSRLLFFQLFFAQVKVMHKQLVLLHNAIAAYFSGNASALEGTLKQFNIKVIGGHSRFGICFSVDLLTDHLHSNFQLKSANTGTAGSWLEQ